MLRITIPAEESWDEQKEEFVITAKEQTLQLEHSLVSLSKWESKWHIPFHDDQKKKTFEQKTVINPAKYQDGVKKLSERIQMEWKTQTDEYLMGIKEELGILKLVSNEKQEIQKILLCMNNFSNWPADESAISQYEKANEKAKEILSRMEFDDVIADFLKKVKDKEASLLDLTDPIIAWIRKEKLSGNIMLSIKN